MIFNLCYQDFATGSRLLVTRPQDAFTDYIRKVASLSEHMLVVQQAHALLRCQSAVQVIMEPLVIHAPDRLEMLVMAMESVLIESVAMEPVFVNPCSKEQLVSYAIETISLDHLATKLARAYMASATMAPREMEHVYHTHAHLVSMETTVTSEMFHVLILR